MEILDWIERGNIVSFNWRWTEGGGLAGNVLLVLRDDGRIARSVISTTKEPIPFLDFVDHRPVATGS